MSERNAWRAQPHVHGARLTDDLRHLGLGSGDVVLVHSSLSRLGHVKGGAPAVVDALLRAVEPGGTVLFPTLTGSEHDGPARPPHLDVRRTVCWTGRIPETARLRPDACRTASLRADRSALVDRSRICIGSAIALSPA